MALESVEEFGNRWRDRALEAELEIERLKAEIDARAGNTAIWNVQRFDQTLGVYSNPEAARAHSDHLIHAHFNHHMDRHRVPDSHRVIDWRVDCCGHLYGPGQFNHTAYPEKHAEGCTRQKSGPVVLRPFWAASGTKVGTGHVSTDWEIWQGVACDQFDPGFDPRTVLV